GLLMESGAPTVAFGPGLHVIASRGWGGEAPAADSPALWPRERRLRALLAPLFAESPRPAPEQLAAAAATHENEGDPKAGICLHLPALAYGTVSTSIVEMDLPAADGRWRGRWLFSSGPPCAAPLVEVAKPV
ncbi:MAG: hypothetical protein HY719_12860, partial [Planctomycetes bacterium]|nr:hypothetical protein [Planctomycetota bacterium]